MTMIGRAWGALRGWLAWMNGDVAYRAYRETWLCEHAQCGYPPPSRAAFYRAELERRWNGVRRCC